MAEQLLHSVSTETSPQVKARPCSYCNTDFKSFIEITLVELAAGYELLCLKRLYSLTKSSSTSIRASPGSRPWMESASRLRRVNS